MAFKLDPLVGGVYEIVNVVNGNRYVGSAVSFSRRFKLHRWRLSQMNHHNRKLQNAWRKWGPDYFIFRPLFICSKKDLIAYEQRCIDSLRPEYNIALVAGSRLGVKQSPEALAKMVAPHKGRKDSAETIAKRVASNAGRVNSPETRAKISVANNGKKNGPRSPETRAKLSIAHKGKKHTAEHRANHSAAVKGQKRSQEYCANHSAMMTAWWAARRAETA